MLGKSIFPSWNNFYCHWHQCKLNFWKGHLFGRCLNFFHPNPCPQYLNEIALSKWHSIHALDVWSQTATLYLCYGCMVPSGNPIHVLFLLIPCAHSNSKEMNLEDYFTTCDIARSRVQNRNDRLPLTKFCLIRFWAVSVPFPSGRWLRSLLPHMLHHLCSNCRQNLNSAVDPPVNVW